jgi:peptidoglycan-associated lipoprotein
MHPHRLSVAGLVAAFSLGWASSLSAQSAGSFEIGGFGQFTRADAAWHVKNGFGFGGRLGVFLNRRWELEADGSISTFENEAPRASGNTTQQTFAGRLTYNLPFGMGGRTSHFLLGVGAGGQRFGGHNDFSISPGAGFRFMLGDFVALRLDGLVEYVENPTAASFGFPPVVGVNEKAARSSNVEIRLGLSFGVGSRREAAPPAPVPTPPREVPPTRVDTQPTPRQVQPTQPTRPAADPDSGARVARAREALLAKLYFDFDRSELRDDQRSVLDAKLPVLRANPGIRIRIEGNADERGSDEYNLALGQRRAQTARQYLINNGIDASRIEIASFGEERPVCQEHNEDCWRLNRRDDFVIIAGGDNIVAPRP